MITSLCTYSETLMGNPIRRNGYGINTRHIATAGMNRDIILVNMKSFAVIPYEGKLWFLNEASCHVSLHTTHIIGIFSFMNY